MTPADRLTRAADTLDRMADDRSPAPFTPDLIVRLTSDPVTVRLIAALLRDEGERHATGMELDCPSGQFLALADHINERSGL